MEESALQDTIEAVGVELVQRDELRGTTAGDQNQVKRTVIKMAFT
jgi:hypothetical protein